MSINGMQGYIIAFVILPLFVVSCGVNAENTSPKAATQTVPSRAFMFSSGEVRLLDGIFKQSQQSEGKYLLSLEADRLLAPFLIEAGLPSKDSIYGGWETSVLPGVALSFYLSGLSRMYMGTGDKEYLDKINYALHELERCQEKSGGYLLGVRDGAKVFDRLAKEGYYAGFGDWGGGNATPFYSLEKLMSGLRDVYRICHIQKALTIWRGIGEWLSGLMIKIPDAELQKLMTVEYGGMNWLLSDLYADTDDKKFLEMSKRWQDSLTVIPSVNGFDRLTNVHANRQFPKFSGLAARYPYSANPGDLAGARYFWERVVYHRSYATGGNSESEYFSPADTLSNRLTPFTAENCNEYNMLRLTSLLYQIEPKAEYADYQERVLFNHSLAAQNPDDGKICYFLPLMSGTQKKYSPLYTDFSCCVCSSMDHYTRHGEFIYAYDDSSLYVNLFIASEAKWKQKAVNIIQDTKFPFSEETTLQIKCDKESEFTMKIRSPRWLASPMVVAINGKAHNFMQKDGYFSITRKWHTGDIVSLKLPMQIRYESMPDDKNKIALFYGPVLLAGELDEADAGALAANMLNPTLLTPNKPVQDWLKPAGDSLRFICNVSKPGPIKVKPLFLLKHGFYNVYWQQMAEKEYEERQYLLKKKEDENLKTDMITVDKVVVGDSISEKNHLLSGHSRTENWPYNLPGMGYSIWRELSDSAGFSYTMKLPKTGSAVLQCRFMGREAYESWNFAILANNDTVLAKQRGKEDRSPVVPYTMNIPLPISAVKDKNVVTIRFAKFQKKSQEAMPRLLELRILHTDEPMP
ncbi:MAG: glycoside hydrolase family 127 protein [Chitinophagaceae bacterium]|nr:glycoside hydrolase family 127 protein [Chitinophagaceae bacterium]